MLDDRPNERLGSRGGRDRHLEPPRVLEARNDEERARDPPVAEREAQVADVVTRQLAGEPRRRGQRPGRRAADARDERVHRAAPAGVSGVSQPPEQIARRRFGPLLEQRRHERPERLALGGTAQRRAIVAAQRGVHVRVFSRLVVLGHSPDRRGHGMDERDVVARRVPETCAVLDICCAARSSARVCWPESTRERRTRVLPCAPTEYVRPHHGQRRLQARAVVRRFATGKIGSARTYRFWKFEALVPEAAIDPPSG
jgi:hypothetical protein